MSNNKKLFLSAVSSEFVTYRDLLAGDLHRPNLDVAVQEDFIVTDGTTLAKIDTYIRHCDAVIHLIGKATGAIPEEPAVAALLAKYPDLPARLPPLAASLRQTQPGFSYTQWEAYLAIYHQRPLFVYRPTDFELEAFNVPRSPRFTFSADEAKSQKEHYQRIAALGRDRGQFATEERLSSAVLRDLVELLPLLQPRADFRADISRIVKYAPADLIGREAELQLLHDAWTKVQNHGKGRPHILTFVALGGEGKTSLVAKWAADLAAQDWPGCDAVFAWSFYSQGTRDQVAASSDLFLKEALLFFATGDAKEEEIKAFAASPAGAYEKGQRLARLVGQRRTLLILDGLEPLQYAPTAPTPGELKDQGIAALLKGLAANSHGLCVVTTRYSLPDLRAFWQTTAAEVKLLRLSRDAGVHLLKSFDVQGSDRKSIPSNNGKDLLSEFEKLVEDVKGHALTLNLLGSYLRDAHGGDIRKRDLIDFAEADAANDHRHHVIHVMDAYVRWLSPSGFRAWMRRLFSQQERETQVEGKRALAVLQLIGLFDRPVTDDCFGALLKPPSIPSLTEPLIELNEAQRNTVLKRLEEAKLLTVNRDASGSLVSLDAHPHLRAYFARQLRTQQPDAWRAAHRRLYEHLCATTKEGDQPTLEDLQPLYQAVAHGCQAGRQADARANVYRDRILRGTGNDGFYSTRKLGAFSSDLGAIACFFETPWNSLLPALTISEQSWLFAVTAFDLRALGRLKEALDPMQAGREMAAARQDWQNAAQSAGNVAELQTVLGELAAALDDAKQAIACADLVPGHMLICANRARFADVLHQLGRRVDAYGIFREAEIVYAEMQSKSDLFPSPSNFYFSDLIFAEAERRAWNLMLKNDIPKNGNNDVSALLKNCQEVEGRGRYVLKQFQNDYQSFPLSAALDHLSVGRAALYATILESRSDVGVATSELKLALYGLRCAGQAQELPRGLLARSWLLALTGARTGPESAQEDLDEAWEIAERGPMRLHMADIHLHRARLFFREAHYPWNQNPDGTPRTAKDDLAAARQLIEQCGYWRRKEELEDAEAVIGK